MKKITWGFLSIFVALFICGGLSGCGDNGDDVAKYLMYKKAGNVRDGFYIEIIGLNVECDDSGELNVDLNEIWTEYQGKLVIPAEIDGLPVKKVSFNTNMQKYTIGGLVNTVNKVPVRFVTNGDDMLYYLDDFSSYLKNIKDLTIPSGVEVDLRDLDDLDNLTISLASLKNFQKSVKNIVFTTDDESKIFNDSLYYSHNKEEAEFHAGLVPALGEKSNVFPNNVKKIDLRNLFYSNYDGDVKEECKGCKIICAPDAEFFITYSEGGGKVTAKLLQQRQVKPEDIYINDKSLVEYIK